MKNQNRKILSSPEYLNYFHPKLGRVWMETGGGVVHQDKDEMDLTRLEVCFLEAKINKSGEVAAAKEVYENFMVGTLQKGLPRIIYDLDDQLFVMIKYLANKNIELGVVIQKRLDSYECNLLLDAPDDLRLRCPFPAPPLRQHLFKGLRPLGLELDHFLTTTVFSNKGQKEETHDHLTIIVPEEADKGFLLGCSDNPFKGFGQFCGDVESVSKMITDLLKDPSDHSMGTEVRLDHQTEKVQRYVAQSTMPTWFDETRRYHATMPNLERQEP